jgi:hypothetical protein
VEATKGKDIQEIPWERFAITREKYRQVRIDLYKNYENIPTSGEAAAKVCLVESPASYAIFSVFMLLTVDTCLETGMQTD